MSNLHEGHDAPVSAWPRRVQAAAAAILAGAIAAALLLIQGGGPVAGSTYTTDQSVVYQDFAGVIRNSGSGWYVIDDSGHEPDDITMGAVASVYVQVEFPLCEQIVSVIVAPDDTYAAGWGLVVGASVGFDTATIKGQVNDGSDAGSAPDVWNPLTDYSSGSNLWISGRCIPA